MYLEMFEDIKSRLETIPGLTTYIGRSKSSPTNPLAVIIPSKMDPTNNREVYPTMKAAMSLSVIVYADTFEELLNLIETIEDALDISKKIPQTMYFLYEGFIIGAEEQGVNARVAQLNFSIEFVKRMKE